VALDERSFFSDKNETRSENLTCTKCRRANQYSVRWVRRTKKDRLPPGADERDRAKFAKLRDHLIRVDDEVVCKTCGRKFEIPSMHSLLFLDQLEGLPRDVEDDDEPVPSPAAGPGSTPQSPSESRPAAADTRAPDRRGPRRPMGPSRGWKG
jgi:hypothetical protein